jgi:metal-responsive CopG/Arc/MetJ family transcriptional regulator
MKRTTIFADENMLRDLKEISEQDNKSVAEVVREAITSYVRVRRKKRKAQPGFVGIGKSGRNDIAEKYEELLWQKLKK